MPSLHVTQVMKISLRSKTQVVEQLVLNYTVASTARHGTKLPAQHSILGTVFWSRAYILGYFRGRNRIILYDVNSEPTIFHAMVAGAFILALQGFTSCRPGILPNSLLSQMLKVFHLLSIQVLETSFHKVYKVRESICLSLSHTPTSLAHQ